MIGIGTLFKYKIGSHQNEKPFQRILGRAFKIYPKLEGIGCENVWMKLQE